VTLHWADLLLIVAMVIAGFAATYFLMLRKVRQVVSESQREMARRLSALTEAIITHEPSLADSFPSTDALAAQEIEAESAPVVHSKPTARVRVDRRPASAEEEIAPEIQVAISAVAMAILGKNARIRSARMLPSRGVVSPWTQQGRVIVQSSHNLRSRERG
jgi:hypothetical protein